MTQDKHEHQMTALMERAMRPVGASEELVSGSLDRGRRAVRRRRTAQAAGVGAFAALVTAGVVVMPSLLGDGPDERSPGFATPAPATVSGGTASRRETDDDGLPPRLRRAQQLLLDVLPDKVGSQFGLASVTYDPDGQGAGELRGIVGLDAPHDETTWQRNCDRIAASAAANDCVDTGEGWLITAPSLPDVSGADPDLAGWEARYLRRDGGYVDLIAYNAPKANLGTAPTRPDPVLDRDDLATLATDPTWFE